MYIYANKYSRIVLRSRFNSKHQQKKQNATIRIESHPAPNQPINPQSFQHTNLFSDA